MKRTLILTSIMLFAAISFGLLSIDKTEAKSSAFLPAIQGYIMQYGNCSSPQDGAKVTFQDLTTQTSLCTMFTGSTGYASCTAQPGDVIRITATYGRQTGCYEFTMPGSSYSFGNLCIGTQCTNGDKH